jgi:hypothetical protein
MSFRKTTSGSMHGIALTPGVTNRERNRLIVLFLLMTAVTAVLLGGFDRFFGDLRRSPPPDEFPGEARSVLPPVEIGVEFVPWNADPIELDALIKDASPVGRGAPTPSALKRLADLTRRRPHSQFLLDPAYREFRGFLTPDVDDVFAHPSRYRAKPVEFAGVLASAERVDTAATFGADVNFGFASQWTGRLRVPGADGAERTVSFLGLDDAFGEPDQLVGSRVKLQGVFYRLSEIGVGGAATPTVFVLAKKLVRALSVPALKELPAGFAASIDDSTFDRQRTVYDDAFYAVFGYVFSNPPARVLGPDPPPTLASRDGWERATELRLKPVRVTGRVQQIRYEPFEYGGDSYQLVRPSDAFATGWYTVYVASLDGEGLYVVGCKDRPAGCEVGDDVEADGVYFRRLLFPNRGAVQPREAPLGYDRALHGLTKASIVFAPHGVRSVSAKPWREATDAFSFTIIALGVIVTLCLAVFVVRDRDLALRASAELRRAKSDRLKAQGIDLTRLARGGADSTKPPGTSDPPFA